MSLEVIRFILGPLDNNVYLVADTNLKTAIIIDPSFGSEHLVDYIQQKDWKLKAIWITHAHFDHYFGASQILKQFGSPIDIALHQDDLKLWNMGGEAPDIGIQMDASIFPNLILQHENLLYVGTHVFRVLHTPGHTQGHVTFYSAEINSAFCGDVIFYRSVGRTDLYGGNFEVLLQSIIQRIFSLPPETQLLSGHGKITTVADEISMNPFIPRDH